MANRKSKTVGLMVLTFSLIFSGFVSAEISDPTGSLAPPEMNEISLHVQTQLFMLKQDIMDNHYSYTVGYSPAMDYPLEQLCGLVEPEDWIGDGNGGVRVRRVAGEKCDTRFMNRRPTC